MSMRSELSHFLSTPVSPLRIPDPCQMHRHYSGLEAAFLGTHEHFRQLTRDILSIYYSPPFSLAATNSYPASLRT